jgi:predicted ATPase
LLLPELLRDRIPDANRFPYSLPAIRSLSRLAFHPKVTFLVGENGSGKSTLLATRADTKHEQIAGALDTS